MLSASEIIAYTGDARFGDARFRFRNQNRVQNYFIVCWNWNQEYQNIKIEWIGIGISDFSPGIKDSLSYHITVVQSKLQARIPHVRSMFSHQSGSMTFPALWADFGQ